MTAFPFDPRLAADSRPVIDLPLSAVRLMRDARFPWLLVIPRLNDIVEVTDLSDYDRRWLFDEVAHAAGVLKRHTAADKMNVATIGNVVPQMHVHVVARRTTDAAWPKPVWGSGAAVPYEPAEEDRLVADLARLLPR